jgi:hypothetical protein
VAIFVVDDLVEVRAAGAHAWRTGMVTEVRENCYVITLDAPLSGNTWTGKTRRLGGNPNISMVCVAKASETAVEGQHVRAR